MSRDSNGTYSLPAGNPVTSGASITSSWANNTLSDIGTELTNSLDKSGRTTPTANLPMGTYKLTGLGAGTANGDSVRYEQVGALSQDSYAVLTTLSPTTGAVSLDTQKVNNLLIPTGNVTLSFTNPRATGSVTAFALILQFGGTGYTVTWPGTVKWPGGSTPTLSGANKVDMFTFFSRDGGTSWFGAQTVRGWSA